MACFDRAFFDRGLDRTGTRSEKWDICPDLPGKDTLPLWVADMDFESPPVCREAILHRAEHPTYGYTCVEEDDASAVTDFWARRHGLCLKPEDAVMLPCVVSGMKVAIRALTEPGDGIIILSPVYGPFRFSVNKTGRKLMDCPLVRRGDGRYDMDMDRIEDALKRGAKAILFCNPHNPVSRLWSRTELTALCDLAERYGAYLISDEIHADFVYAPGEFTPALSVNRERVISFCAASKTFNLAGLQQATCLCPDPTIREKIRNTIDSCGVTSGNIFALEATRAAYTQGDAWLDGLTAYLDINRKTLAELVRTELPDAVLTPVEATYLGWIDLSAWGFDCEELKRRTEKAGVIFTIGDFFGTGGEGKIRFNFACPERNIMEGVARLKKALEYRPGF